MKLRAPKPTTVPAVRASAALENWYLVRLQKMLDDMHRSITLHLRAAWKREDPDIGFAQDEGSEAFWKRVFTKWGKDWISKFDDLSLDMAKMFAGRNRQYTDQAVQAAFKKAGFTVSFNPTQRMMDSYRAVVSENVNLIKSIPQQYLKDVQTAVFTNVMKGGDLHALGTSLAKTYGVSLRRASLIARDQNRKAFAIMENVRRQELGVTQARWLHSGGGKEPRPSHVRASRDRVIFDLSKGWYDPDEGENIWPGQLINCRCTSIAIIEPFED